MYKCHLFDLTTTALFTSIISHYSFVIIVDCCCDIVEKSSVVGGNARDLKSLADLDSMIAQSLHDVPEDDSDLSDTDDPNLLVSYTLEMYILLVGQQCGQHVV